MLFNRPPPVRRIFPSLRTDRETWGRYVLSRIRGSLMMKRTGFGFNSSGVTTLKG